MNQYRRSKKRSKRKVKKKIKVNIKKGEYFLKKIITKQIYF